MQPGWEVLTGSQIRVSQRPAVNTSLLGALNTSTPTLTWGPGSNPVHQCHTQDTELSAPLSVSGSCSPILQLWPIPQLLPQGRRAPSPAVQPGHALSHPGPCSSVALSHLLYKTGV